MSDDEFLLDNGKMGDILQSELTEALNQLRVWKAVAASERDRRLEVEAVLTTKQRQQLQSTSDE